MLNNKEIQQRLNDIFSQHDDLFSSLINSPQTIEENAFSKIWNDIKKEISQFGADPFLLTFSLPVYESIAGQLIRNFGFFTGVALPGLQGISQRFYKPIGSLPNMLFSPEQSVASLDYFDPIQFNVIAESYGFFPGFTDKIEETPYGAQLLIRRLKKKSVKKTYPLRLVPKTLSTAMPIKEDHEPNLARVFYTFCKRLNTAGLNPPQHAKIWKPTKSFEEVLLGDRPTNVYRILEYDTQNPELNQVISPNKPAPSFLPITVTNFGAPYWGSPYAIYYDLKGNFFKYQPTETAYRAKVQPRHASSFYDFPLPTRGSNYLNPRSSFGSLQFELQNIGRGRIRIGNHDHYMARQAFKSSGFYETTQHRQILQEEDRNNAKIAKIWQGYIEEKLRKPEPFLNDSDILAAIIATVEERFEYSEEKDLATRAADKEWASSQEQNKWHEIFKRAHKGGGSLAKGSDFEMTAIVVYLCLFYNIPALPQLVYPILADGSTGPLRVHPLILLRNPADNNFLLIHPKIRTSCAYTWGRDIFLESDQPKEPIKPSVRTVLNDLEKNAFSALGTLFESARTSSEQQLIFTTGIKPHSADADQTDPLTNARYKISVDNKTTALPDYLIRHVFWDLIGDNTLSTEDMNSLFSLSSEAEDTQLIIEDQHTNKDSLSQIPFVPIAGKLLETKSHKKTFKIAKRNSIPTEQMIINARSFADSLKLEVSKELVLADLGLSEEQAAAMTPKQAIAYVRKHLENTHIYLKNPGEDPLHVDFVKTWDKNAPDCALRYWRHISNPARKINGKHPGQCQEISFRATQYLRALNVPVALSSGMRFDKETGLSTVGHAHPLIIFKDDNGFAATKFEYQTQSVRLSPKQLPQPQNKLTLEATASLIVSSMIAGLKKFVELFEKKEAPLSDRELLQKIQAAQKEKQQQAKEKQKEVMDEAQITLKKSNLTVPISLSEQAISKINTILSTLEDCATVQTTTTEENLLDELLVNAFALKEIEFTLQQDSDFWRQRIHQHYQKKALERAEEIERRIAESSTISEEAQRVLQHLIGQALLSDKRKIIFVTTDQQN